MSGKVKVAPVEVFGDYLLVRRDQREELRTPGGIVVPTQGQQDPTTGTVVALGAAAQQDLGVAIGDRVIVSRWAGAPIRVGEEDLTVFRAPDIIGRMGPGGAP